MGKIYNKASSPPSTLFSGVSKVLSGVAAPDVISESVMLVGAPMIITETITEVGTCTT